MTTVAIPPPQDVSFKEDSSKLWIGNLDQRLTDYALLKIVQKYGELKKFDLIYHAEGSEAGKQHSYCFVTYSTRQEAENALENLNGNLVLNKKLSVKWAAEKEPIASGEGSGTTSQEMTSAVALETLSTKSKIEAIEAKLKAMEESQKEFTLSFKPAAPPGTSKWSSVNTVSSDKKKLKSYKRYHHTKTNQRSNSYNRRSHPYDRRFHRRR